MISFVFLFLGFLSVCQLSFAQDWPKEVTPEVLKKIKADVEKEVPAYKKSLEEKEYNTDQIEFSADTFRIARVFSRRMDFDYSTMGINIAIGEMAEGYDKLLNKYYNKLQQLLKPADKKVLVAAQRAWLAYRKAEQELISTMTKEEYSGGGTMQSNIANNAYADLVVQRAIEIFSYYDNVLKEK